MIVARRPALIALLIAAAGLAAAPAARATIHDVVRAGHLPATAAAAPHGGRFRAADGTTLKVLESSAFPRDDAELQGWANFFGSLVHGPELSKLTVYIAPFAEVQKKCESKTADSCYYPDANEIILVRDPPPGHDPVPAIAAHEYGHHVAAHRKNDIGAAMDWGPTYWGSYEDVCDRADARTAYPGDEDRHYELNPGEAWAETYRILNGQEPQLWDIIDNSFFPDATALRRAREDVKNPYDGGEFINRRGSFGRRGSSWRHVKAPVENDGTVALRLTTTGSLDGDLYVFENRHSRHPIDWSRRRGHTERLVGKYCGYRHLDVRVRRKRGSGKFKLRLTLPYFTTR